MAIFLLAAAIENARAQSPISIGMDHIGITVPDVDSAALFFEQVLGTKKVTEIGPFPMDSTMKSRYKIHSDATLDKIAMLRAGNGSNLELFEFHSPKASKAVPYTDDIGALHIAFYTNDINKSIAFLKSKGIQVLNDPIVANDNQTGGETWVYFLTPWGQQIELVTYPEGKAYEKSHPKVKLWTPKGK
ncbi:MAG: putative lyase [Mucilaginibacter sp.]|nr:putative lyase [Mucilaginibacter sp.]